MYYLTTGPRLFPVLSSSQLPIYIFNPSGRHFQSPIDTRYFRSFQLSFFITNLCVDHSDRVLNIQSFFWTIAIVTLNHQSIISTIAIVILDLQSTVSTIAIVSSITNRELIPLLNDMASHNFRCSWSPATTTAKTWFSKCEKSFCFKVAVLTKMWLELWRRKCDVFFARTFQHSYCWFTKYWMCDLGNTVRVLVKYLKRM